jgi:Bacterial Ig-like domain
MLARRFSAWFLFAVVLGLCSAGQAGADGAGPVVVLESPADGGGFYQGQHAQAAYGCLPGPLDWPVVECVGDVPLGEPLDTSSVGEHTFTVRAVDYAGSETTVTHTYTVFDVIAPAVTIRSPADGAVYPYGAEVVADYSCDDGPGGSEIAGCIGSLPNGAPMPTDRVGTFTFRVDAYDSAFNHGTMTASYTVVDVTPPIITVSSPADGAQFHLGEVVTPQYRCDDELEGARVFCKATPIDTSTYGEHTFRVDARDSSGNAAAVVRTYSVVYDFEGFFAPLAPQPAVATVKAGDDVPVKFSLDGYQGLDVFAAPPAWKPGCPSPSFDSSRAFGTLTYKASVARYVFLWKSDPSWAGSCRELIVRFADGTVRRANVRFR